jgi:hypothetical protein
VEKKDGTRLSGPENRGLNKINRNVIVFAFFLLLSFVFWYLNSLGKDLQTDIRYPVKYVNIPKGKTLSAGLPSRLNLFLQGPGYSILQLKTTGNSMPLEVDFSSIKVRSDPDHKPADYYIVTSEMIKDINSQLKSECRVISVKPDTLYFSYNQAIN